MNRRGRFVIEVVLAVGCLRSAANCAPPQVGQQFRWTLSLQAGLQDQAGGPRQSIALSGEWRSTVVAVRPDSYDVRFQLASVHIEGSKAKRIDAKELSLAQERLSRPCWATFGQNGALRMVHFAKEVSPSDRNLLQMIAAESQFVPADTAVWTAIERDGAGSYLAIYQRLGPFRVRKKRLKYLDGTSASPALPAVIEESQAEFAFTPEGAIAALDGVQQVRLSIPGAAGNSLTTRIELHLGNLRAGLDPVLARSLAIPKQVEHLPIEAHQPDPRAAQASMDRKLLAGRSTGEILAGAARNDPAANQRLAALFRRRPESIPLALRSFAAGGGAQAIASGLAEAGTTRSIGALSAVAHDETRAVGARVSALSALAGIREPAADAMRIPADLLEDRNPQVRNAALLAAGALARAGRSAHPAESDKIEAALAERYRAAKTAAESTEMLAALGNSAGPRAAALLAVSLKDSREDVRAAAARGLRLVPGAAADSLLAETVRKDPSPAVRSAALFAIGFRLPLRAVLRDAVLSAAKHDAADMVRNRALSLLGNDADRLQ